jgi:hypothetical protein
MRAPLQRTAPRARILKESGPIVVADDWPERVPICDAKLRAIEGHLRKELDDGGHFHDGVLALGLGRLGAVVPIVELVPAGGRPLMNGTERPRSGLRG